jgi:[CysO sulfur-carrier protein]-S-L-cysteine hydrolase
MQPRKHENSKKNIVLHFRAMSAPEFRIRHAALEEVITHARAAQPVECCGMLLGTAPTIEEAIQAKNLAASPTRFLIDPRDHINARRTARTRGLDVIGFYHSHPHSPAWPSPTDLAEAAYPDAVYLIVSLAGAAAEARLFRIGPVGATELPLISIR